jgi:hypothetical protein
MTPFIALAGLLAVGWLPNAQAPIPQAKQPKAMYHYKILHGATQIGDASYIRISTATDRQIKLTVNETVDGITLSAVFDTTSKNDGTPTKKSFHGVLGQRPFLSTAEFSDVGVIFTLQDIKGDTQKATIKPPANAVLADASDAWFDSVTPKKGDSATFTNFDIQNGKWELTTTTYVGDEQTKVGKAMVTAHHLHVKSDSGELDLFVDDSADIVVMDQGASGRLERAD